MRDSGPIAFLSSHPRLIRLAATAVVVVIGACLYESQPVWTLESGNDRRQYPEIEIQPSDKAGGNASRIGSSHPCRIGSPGYELGLTNHIDRVRRCIRHQNEAIIGRD